MALKKPKPKKLPKKPKSRASNEAMANYLKKVDEIQKTNAKAQSDYQKAVKEREALKKRIAKI